MPVRSLDPFKRGVASGEVRAGGDRDPRKWGEGEETVIHLTLHCHRQDNFYIKTGSNEIHFNVTLPV